MDCLDSTNESAWFGHIGYIKSKLRRERVSDASKRIVSAGSTCRTAAPPNEDGGDDGAGRHQHVAKAYHYHPRRTGTGTGTGLVIGHAVAVLRRGNREPDYDREIDPEQEPPPSVAGPKEESKRERDEN